jgi:hypothetical protein
MGISYDPPSKKWNVVYEKTDYKTDYPIDTSAMPTLAEYGLVYPGKTLNAQRWNAQKDKQNAAKNARLYAAMKVWDTNQELK